MTDHETSPLPHLVSRYATRFHSAVAEEHHVASPLGAWVLLALAAGAASGEDREELEHVLGCTVERAGSLAAGLLGEDHPAVSSAVAAWVRERAMTPGMTSWLGAMPPGVERGGVPSQAEADAWAAKRTRDLIKEFPLEVKDETMLVLVSALATKISWREPFDLAPAADLKSERWGGKVQQVLRSPESHTTMLVQTERAGIVGVHAVRSDDGLMVVSVIGGEDVSRSDVFAAAHEVATGDLYRLRHSLFDMPLGTGHAWEIAETTQTMVTHEDQVERTHALLPAWSAKSDHDLTSDRSFGFQAGSPGLAGLLPPNPDGHDVEAKQVAVAAYSRTGFEAAAVTAWGVAEAAMARPMPRDVTVREAEIRFHRPYAVVAVALQSGWDRDKQRMHEGPWHELPVFSTWVAEVDEADEA